MNRIEIINAVIKKIKAKSYLEIGVQAGDCFKAVECAEKVGVDPDVSSAATIHEPSDVFFAKNKNKFDVIFIDGLHESETVYRDIVSSLLCLNEGGVILMHDCLPTNKFMQEIPQTTQGEWTGDCWKAYVKMRIEREDLFMCVINTDWGVGFITAGGQDKLQLKEAVTYENFVLNKQRWMNIVSVDEFKKSVI